MEINGEVLRLALWAAFLHHERMSMARVKIFVSSVQKELGEERQAIKSFVAGDSLLRRFFDVFLFEDIPASDRRADDVYLEEVDRCAIYVGLFGDAYGCEGPEGKSPTEIEYDRATQKSKLRLIFVKGAHDDNRHVKMLALIRKAGDQLVRRRFGSIPELTTGLYASLVEYLISSGAIHTGPFDAAVCSGATMTDISRAKITSFLERAQAERDYALGPRTPVQKALTHLNLLAGERPTHAAILLFGKKPQRFMITSEVKCMHFHGLEARKPIPSYHIYKGDLFEMVDQAADFVMSKLARAVIPRDGKVASDVEYELPWKAVREAIVNAVTHRDYASNGSVQVMLFADRLEIWNPGELPPALSIAKLHHPHPSLPRNPLIADPMFLTRYAEKAGSGILDMLQQCQDAGLREPEFRQDGGFFVQTMWRPKSAAAVQVPSPLGTKSALSRHQVGILRKCNNDSTLVALMEIAGRSDRTKFRHQVVSPLLEEGLLEMTIPSRPTSRMQKYRLTAKGRVRLDKDAKG